MDSNNPYEPPRSDLVHPDLERGPADVALIPWEDKAGFPGFGERALATMKLMFRPAKAGPSLGLHRHLGPAITYFLCVGLPLVWLAALLNAFFGPADPAGPIFEQFKLPHSAPPPEIVQLQKMIQVGAALLMPLFMAIGLAMMGFLIYVGLWLVRALRPGRGLEATFRTLLYGYGTFNALLWIFNLWVYLPVWGGLALLGMSIIASLGFWVLQGVLLAKAHGTDTWRGVLGVFLPWILLVCCCGGFAAAIGGLAAFAARAR